MTPRRLFLYAFLAVSLASACQSTFPSREFDPANIENLTKRLLADTSDALVHRDLGALLLRADRINEAAPHLRLAFSVLPNDEKTRYFYGRLLEREGYGNDAIPVYAAYADLPQSSAYRKLMYGRYLLIKRAKDRFDILARRDSVEEGRTVTVDENAIAVLPFKYEGGGSQYQPLGEALSLSIVTALAQVQGLTLLERHQLEPLLAERSIAENSYQEILGAGNLIGGTYSVEDDELKLDLYLLRFGVSDPAPIKESAPLDDRLDEFQTSLIFRVADAIQLELTQEEINAIAPIPTRNLQALLAYGRGIAEETAGNYASASIQFSNALQAAPDFSLPSSGLENSLALETSNSNPEDILFPPGINDALVQQLQDRLSSNLGTLTTPGQDAREPAPEAINASDSGYLETPPVPPILPN